MKSTTAIHKIKIEFSLQQVTRFGDVKIFLGLSRKNQARRGPAGPLRRQSAQRHFPCSSHLALSHHGWMLGRERIVHFRKLQHNALLRRFLGGRLPHNTSLDFSWISAYIIL